MHVEVKYRIHVLEASQQVWGRGRPRPSPSAPWSVLAPPVQTVVVEFPEAWLASVPRTAAPTPKHLVCEH